MESPSGLPRINNFIDGQFRDPVNDKWIDNYNPSTGTVYSLVADSDDNDVELAYQAAAKAFPGWKKMPREERSKVLNKIADLIEARKQEFAEAESKDQGKPVTLASAMDIGRVVANFRFFAGAILHHEEMSTEMDGVAINYTVRQPIGVAGLISPWNLPLYLLSWKIAPCIAVGNTCVCKPSEMTSMTAWMMAGVLNDAGLPAGVVNLVMGVGPRAGNAIVTHPRIPLISFTGGTVTAKHIIVNSAPLYKKLALELGGKNPTIIFDDANLDKHIDAIVRSAFLNQGEICLCGSRMIVQESIYPEFLKRFVEKANQIVVGDPTAKTTNMGALISKEHLAKVTSYVEQARKEGATIECGGDRPSDLPAELEGGYWLRPTIITGLLHDSCVLQDEIFGPVVTITKFKTEDEAVEQANCVKYGLACSIWTENSGRTHRVALAVHAGTVWVNTWLMRDLRVPFGGMKASGIGREGGEHSIDSYTERKTVCIRYDM